MIAKWKSFLNEGIWRVEAGKVSKKEAFFVRLVRTLVLAKKCFDANGCRMRASALTFYTLLSIVPVFAMVFGIAKGFGLEQMLHDMLTQQLQGQGDVMGRIIEFSDSLLENAKGGVIAGVGVVLLFWTVIKVLGHIESSFNAIWGIRTERSMSRKFSDYLAIMMVCPILFVTASSATVFVTGFITTIVAHVAVLGHVSGLIVASLKFLPYLVIWVLFSFMYIVMPNGRVNLASGVIGGVVAGTVYQVMQWVYIAFQIGVTKTNAIYGSFAALPLFLVWLQTSWLIVLFGAEIAYAHQNDAMHEYEPDCETASIHVKRRAVLLVLSELIRGFVKAEPAPDAAALSGRLSLPIRLVRQSLVSLVHAKLVSELSVSDDGKEHTYQPAEDVDTMTISSVFSRLEHDGTANIPRPQTETYQRIQKAYEEMLEKVREAGATRVRDLV